MEKTTSTEPENENPENELTGEELDQVSGGRKAGEQPKEAISFEYGGLVVKYVQQSQDGSLDKK